VVTRLDDPALLATMSEDEIARTLEMSPASLAEVAQTIAANPNSTIEPARARSDALGKIALEGLGEQRGERGVAGGLELGATIGEGGMGVVRSATQRSLGRKVAVKTLRAQTKTEAATLRLLREAWVTGSLEHPNIVPVYDLGLDDDGSPIIVLKHIEGVEWASLMHDAKAVKERFGATDLFEHNLRILVQLCNAVSLAHSRGILHRDLKPENVMVGRFGEVYLVDWGIAVSLWDDPTGRLPLASKSQEMAGTPSYMAPEMLGALGALSERTDVYLLGAILHEILTGKPPHVGPNFRSIVASILLSTFQYPDDAPSELVAVAKKAMSRQPEARFASADEVRQKLEWYLRHRGSLALSAEAGRRLDEMRELLAISRRTDAAGGLPEEQRNRVYRLFAEARFGFRQAFEACHDNTDAAKGLRSATEMIVTFELESGTAEAAAAALAELGDPPSDLARRVADALRQRDARRVEIARLEKLGADLDPATGRRTRMSATAMLGIFWTIAPEIAGLLERRYPNYEHWWMYIATLSITVLGFFVATWGRESLTKTAVNRGLLAVGLINFSGQFAVQVGGHLLDLPKSSTLVLHLLVWWLSTTMLAAFIDRRLWPSSAWFLLGFVVASARPDIKWHVMTATDFGLLLNILIAWSRPDEDRGFFRRRMKERIDRFPVGRRR
jgi:eukaryotic-like serine/threonine-protein kinase